MAPTKTPSVKTPRVKSTRKAGRKMSDNDLRAVAGLSGSGNAASGLATGISQGLILKRKIEAVNKKKAAARAGSVATPIVPKGSSKSKSK